MAKYCMCNKYRINIKTINDSLKLSQIHDVDFSEFDYWDYCPWCGRELFGDHNDGYPGPF